MAPHQSPAEILEELCADQRRRWQSGDRVTAASYLEQHPTLASAAEYAVELVYNEILLRQELGEQPRPEDYLAAFPHLDPELRRVFEVHGALESGNVFRRSQLETSLQDRTPTALLPPREMPVVPGYDILRELGQGGMGVVYQARHLTLNRLVALKMIRAGEQARPADLARFRAEAQAVARLQHPNIVQIHEIGEVQGRPFLALEFVAGGSLAQRLAGTPQPAASAAELVETLARAMDHAHRHGVVHRDLKPANVLLVSGGVVSSEWSKDSSPTTHHSPLTTHQPKIADFGLAKKLDEEGQTQSGAILGTPPYMAPEQASGGMDAVGPLVDVYALGAILYELLTGRPPFRGTTALETLLQVRSQEPVPPTRLQPSCPRDLETICLKCLQKPPHRRYTSAEELAADLRRFRAGEPIIARPVGRGERAWRWCRRKPAVAALLAVVALLVVTGVPALALLWWQAEANYDKAEERLVEVGRQKVAAEQNLTKAQLEYNRAEKNLKDNRQLTREHFIKLSQIELSKHPGTQKFQKELLEKALAYFQQFLDQHPSDPVMRNEVAEAHFRVAMITSRIGRGDQAVKSYQAACALFEQLRREGGAGYALLTDLGGAYNNIGLLETDRGQWQAAQSALQKGLAVRKELLQAHPGDLRCQINLGHSYLNLGNVLRKTDQSAAAAESYEEACRLLRPPADQGAADAMRGLATALNNLSHMYQEKGQREAAVSAHREASALYLKLVTALGGDDELHAEQAAVDRDSLGILEFAAGRLPQARQAHEAACAILAPLVEANPDVTRYRGELARILLNLGLTQQDLGQWPQAQQSYEQAQAHLAHLVKIDAECTDFQRLLALSHNYVGDTQRLLRKWDPSQRSHEQALAIQEQLVRTHPGVSAFRCDLARSHNYLGLLHGDRGEVGKALACHDEARKIQRALVDGQPTVLEYQVALARSHMEIGHLQVRKNASLALESYEEARKLQEKLVAAQPGTPAYLDALAANWNHIGILLEKAGKRAPALAAYTEACNLREQLRQDHPHYRGNDWQLADVYYNLGTAYLDKSVYDALPHLDAAVAILDQLFKDNPGNVDLRRRLADTHHSRGEGLAKLHRLKQALAAYQKAIEHGLAILKSDPGDDQYRRYLSMDYAAAGLVLRLLGQPADAAATALERRKLWPTNGKELYKVACDLAQCVAVVQKKGKLSDADRDRCRQIGDDAVETLRQALACGFSDLQKLQSDPYLQPLRAREDFETLVQPAGRSGRSP
jgi:serine/threonine protein kinase/tetratricopeptide (TPR) repeat protein